MHNIDIADRKCELHHLCFPKVERIDIEMNLEDVRWYIDRLALEVGGGRDSSSGRNPMRFKRDKAYSLGNPFLHRQNGGRNLATSLPRQVNNEKSVCHLD